ncbi:cytokine receptor [Uranotaenia lowii]|uniref:cytokine receptor n=1 Tax=Uranotaenia lowii TaxID=190385 RepID=UPI002478FECC|nr:cytokine receptor [Uranotaenia lowii]
MVQYSMWKSIVYFLCICSAHGLGWISPEGAIYKLVNQSYSLSCTLNRSDPETAKYSSKDLMFYIKDVPVPTEQVRIINESTIQLNVHNAPVSTGIAYMCKLNHTKGVGMRSVNVGYKPYNVTNFKCRSENWQKMNCSFQQVHNPIPTNYSLTFRFDTSPVSFECDLEGQFNNTWKCSVDMDLGYRQSHEIYYFLLESKNIFGTNREQFVINNFDNVIPEAPSECTVSNLTSTDAVLHWTISYKLQTFKRNFVFQVKILSGFDNKVWKNVNVDKLSRSVINYSLPMHNLPYADTRYDVRIRMRTATAEDTEEMWSNYSSCLFNTLPRRPDNPPEVALGGFEINVYNDIFVYWKDIPKSKHNSATGFQYKIVEIKRNGHVISNLTEGRNGSTMIQFRNLTDGNYTFLIRSVNSEGESLKASELFIPSKQHRIPKPEISKLLSDSGRYLLSWKPVNSYESKITSYTVIWCNSSSNSPNDCNGSINFDYVKGNQTSYELNNVSSTLNFAVSANSGKLSSGMVWASCTATQKNDIGKLKSIWIPAMQSTYIDLEWKLECGDSAIVEGFIILYCPINSPRDQSCKIPEESLNITVGTTSYRISKLTPYVTYKIQIAMYSAFRIGPRSDPLFNTTLEAAPSPPRDLVCKEIRNDSIILQWKPPLQINGGKMNYEIWYNHLHTKVYTENYTNDMTYTLWNLEPYTSYKILVLAYTISYSNKSNTIDVITEIGTPGQMQQPESMDQNGTKLAIVWQQPERKAGCIEYYELKTKMIAQNEETVTINKVLGTRCYLKQTICQLAADNNRTDKYEFSVRAVNIILSPHAQNYSLWNKLDCREKKSYYMNQSTPRTHRSFTNSIECETPNQDRFIDWKKIDPFATVLYGKWSSPLAHWCNYGPDNPKAIIFLTIVVCVGIASLLICTYKSLKTMKEIKNIKVVLPDALNDIVSLDKSDISREDSIANGHDNFNGLLEKVQQEDSLLPFSNNGRHISNHVPTLDDTTSLDYTEENMDSEGGGANEEDFLSLGYDKQQFDRESENDMYISTPPLKPEKVQSNHRNFSNTGYVLSPATKPCTNGYVEAPLKKPIYSNYAQPSTLMSVQNNTVSKMPIIVSTATDGISGYVTHKQLSDYGHKLQ